MDLERIHELARGSLLNRSSHVWKEPGNKFYHGERTALLARRLRAGIFPGDTEDADILTVAAWLHDLRNGEERHQELGAEDARRLLLPYCTPRELDMITRIIRRHDDRTAPRESFSRLELLHQDADLLDHFGCYDVWLYFLLGAHERMTPGDMVARMRRERETDYEYWLSRLNFELSRRIYREKVRFVASFCDRFEQELRGEVPGWDELLRGLSEDGRA